MATQQITVIDGPPGTGKTRTIIEQAETWGHESAILTYTNDAAAVIKQRAPTLASGTVYSLTWPYVKPFTTNTKTYSAGSSRTYGRRRIKHLFDPALIQYEKDAPGAKAKTRQDQLAKQLHAWQGGDPPFNLQQEQPKGALKFILPLARWVEAGCPVPEDEQLEQIAIDEAQDMSWVELRAAVGLVRADGKVTAYGDPGQSIFGAAKGIVGGALPPIWLMADTEIGMKKGWRVGDPTASAAARVLSSYYSRPASTFRADHTTEMLSWSSLTARPMRGLVLGYSRRNVAKAFRDWGLHETGVVPNVAIADQELVLSTGHAAKGAEADDVYLLPWSRIALERFERKEPETVRLLYVMLTRARRRVFLPRALKARIPL